MLDAGCTFFSSLPPLHRQLLAGSPHVFFLVASWPCKEVALLVHLQFSVQLNTGINVVFPLALG